MCYIVLAAKPTPKVSVASACLHTIVTPPPQFKIPRSTPAASMAFTSTFTCSHACTHTYTHTHALTQLGLFTPLRSSGDAEKEPSGVSEDVMSPTHLEFGKPTKSSETFVVGRSHEFVESDVKFRIPPVCAYCSVIIQRMCSLEVYHCIPVHKLYISCNTITHRS